MLDRHVKILLELPDPRSGCVAETQQDEGQDDENGLIDHGIQLRDLRWRHSGRGERRQGKGKSARHFGFEGGVVTTQRRPSVSIFPKKWALPLYVLCFCLFMGYLPRDCLDVEAPISAPRILHVHLHLELQPELAADQLHIVLLRCRPVEGRLVEAEPVLVALDTASGREPRALPQSHVVTQSLLQELRRLQLGLIEAYNASCGNGLVRLAVVEAED